MVAEAIRRSWLADKRRIRIVRYGWQTPEPFDEMSVFTRQEVPLPRDRMDRHARCGIRAMIFSTRQA